MANVQRDEQWVSGVAAALGSGKQFLAEEEGFEPSNAGIKIRCLNQLGDSPTRDAHLGDEQPTSGDAVSVLTNPAKGGVANLGKP